MPGVELRRGRSQTAVPEREVVLRARGGGRTAVFEPRIFGAHQSRRRPGREGGRSQATQPPFGVVEGRIRRGHESAGFRELGEHRTVVGVRAARLRPVQLEKKGRGSRLAGLREIAKIEFRVAGGERSAQARHARPERADPLPGAIPLHREPGRLEGVVDAPPLVVEQDRVFEIASRVARLVETQQEGVAAARKPAYRKEADVDPAGTGAVRKHGELPDGVAQAFDRVAEPHGCRRQLGDFAKECLERGPGGDVELVGDAGELRHERPGPARQVAQGLARRFAGRQRDRAGGERAGEPGRGEAPGPRRGTFGRRQVVFAGLVAPRRALGTFEMPDEPSDRDGVTLSTPTHARLADRAGDGARTGSIVAGSEASQAQRARSQGASQGVGGEALGDPGEKRQGGLSRPAVRHGDAARERARHVVLAGELPDQGRIDRVVGMEELDVVEGQSLGQDAAKNFADLVLFADGSKDLSARGPRGPGRRLVHRQDLETVPGDPLEEPALELRELRVRGQQVDRRGRRRSALPRGAGQDVEAVDVFARSEGRRVRPEDAADLPAFARIGERRRGNAPKSDPRLPQLVERPSQRAVESGPPGEAAEVGSRLQSLRARLLDEGQGLGPGKKAQTLAGEVRPRDLQGDRARSLDAQVHVRVALTGQAFDELVADVRDGATRTFSSSGWSLQIRASSSTSPSAREVSGASPKGSMGCSAIAAPILT